MCSSHVSASETQSLPKHLANIFRESSLPCFGGLAWCGSLVGRLAVIRARQECIRYRSTLDCCFPGDLPTRIDAVSVLKKGGIGVMNEAVEFCHRAVLPKECAAIEELIT